MSHAPLPPPLADTGYLRSNAPWLAAGAVLMFSSSYGQTFFISIFSGQIRGDFGLSDGAWGLIYTLGTGLSALAMLWAGALTDRWRARALAAVVLPMLALACLAMAALPVGWVWALPLLILALRFAGQGMTSHIATVSMARWFSASRGKAVSIALMGFALAEACLPLIFVSLMQHVGWRWLWVLAAAMALAALPLVAVLLRRERTPHSVAESQSVSGMDNRHWRRSEALRHPLFWCMVPMILGPAAFITAFFFHQVALAETKGWTHLSLVALFPVYTLCSVVGMWVWGTALDRLGTPRLIVWVQVPMAAGFAILAIADSLALAALGMVFLGLSHGGNATLLPAFWAEFFGTRHLGAIKATAAAIMVLGSAIGPGVTGVAVDLGLRIDTQMIAIAGWFLMASALVTLGVGRARSRLPGAVA